MKRRPLIFGVGSAALLALVVSLSIASAGTTRPASATAIGAPPVPNAKAIKAKYGGQSITFIGDSVGGGHTRDAALATRFSKDTGIKVKVQPHPTASDASYSQLARVFTSQVVLVRRRDDRRRLARRVRAVPRRPEAEARQAGKAARGRDRRERHRRREARRDALVRRLRDPLLPDRPAEEVRLLEAADDLDPALRDGEEDPGRRAGVQPDVLRLRLPGEQLRGPHLRRAGVDRLVGWRPVHRRTAR